MEDENPLNETETNELMNYLERVCKIVDIIHERSKSSKPCHFEMSIDDECYSIIVKKTESFHNVNECIDVVNL